MGDREATRRDLMRVTATAAIASAGLTQAGTADADVTEIADWHDLDTVRDGLDENYRLVNDLDERTAGYATHVASPDEGWNPIGEDTDPFTGTFDGNDHTISGVQIEGGSDDVVGLFATNAGRIEHLELVDCTITASISVGGIAGANVGTIVDCHVSGTVATSGEGFRSGQAIGGVVGGNLDGEENDHELDSTGELTGCSFTGTVTGARGIGGLVGANEGRIEDCAVEDASVTGNGFTGGLTGGTDGDVTNSYYNVDTVEINETKRLTSYGIFGSQYDDWQSNGKQLNVEDYESLSSSDSFIEIGTVRGFRDAQAFIYDADNSFQITSDLDLTESDVSLYFPRIAGSLIGGGHTVTVDIDLPEHPQNAVGFVGEFGGSGLDNLRSLCVDGSVRGPNQVGGLVGRLSEGQITDCCSRCDVRGDERVGVLAGTNASEITSCSTDGSVTGEIAVGGLVGGNWDSIERCTAASAVNGDPEEHRTGGLVGYNDADGEIRFCSASGTVSGGRQIGGLVGGNFGTVELSTASGGVSGTGIGPVGGLAGDVLREGTVTKSHAHGAVEGEERVGGFAGRIQQATVTESYATGTVDGTEDTGGFVGEGRRAETDACYWDEDTTEQSVGIGEGEPEGIHGLSTGQMQGDTAPDELDGFDFEETWETEAGPDDYPRLAWQSPTAPTFSIDIEHAGPTWLDISPERQIIAHEGETISVDVSVSNFGELAGAKSVELDIEPVGSDETTVELEPSERTVTELTVPTEEGDGGEYVASLSTEDDSVEVDVFITFPPSFAVEIGEVNEPTAGNPLEVSFDVENTGTVTSTQTVELDAGALGADTVSVELDGEESVTETVTFPTADGDAGDYTLELSSEDETVTEGITVAEEESTTDDSVDDSPGDDGSVDDDGPGFGVGGALAALGGTGYLLSERLTEDETESE